MSTSSVVQIIDTSCSRRSLEIEQIRDFFRGNDWNVSDKDWEIDPKADLIYLSTCGFTKAAEDFGFETYERIIGGKGENAKVVFGGCIPDINPDRLAKHYDGVPVGPQHYERLNDIVEPAHKLEEFRRPNLVRPRAKNPVVTIADDILRFRQLMAVFDGSFSGLGHIVRRVNVALKKRIIRRFFANLSSDSTFYVQIQEGCSMACSYCAIHKAIGPLRSRPVADLVEEIKTGIAAGHKTIQLMGDNAGSYGLDRKTNLGVLLNEISKLEGDFRIDLTDINPVYLRLIHGAVVKLVEQGRLARLYVPIQTGSDRILRLMKRGCDMTEVRAVLKEIRSISNGRIYMGTSVIVGYPSETREELEQTIDFCRDVGFDWVWCHSYSNREADGAPVEGAVGDDEILARADRFKAALARKALVTTATDTAGSKSCQG